MFFEGWVLRVGVILSARRWVCSVVLGWGLAGVWCPPVLAAVDVDELLKRCAPNVHPETMRAVLSTESRGNVLAVADAGPVALPWSQRKSMVRSHYPATTGEAVALVQDLLARGHTVSLGLAQINDRNLARLGLTVQDVFEPCVNVAAGASILSAFYASAVKEYGSGPRALRAALSAYNSGSFVRGEQDGYVDLVFQQAGKPLVLREGVPGGGGGVVPALSTVGAAPAGGWARVSATPARSAKGARRGGKDFTMLVTSFEEN